MVSYLNQTECVLTFESSWYTFLSAGDVETRWSDGVIGSTLETLLFVNLLEQVVGSVLRSRGIIYLAPSVRHQTLWRQTTRLCFISRVPFAPQVCGFHFSQSADLWHLSSVVVWSTNTYYDVPGQVDAICHCADFFECVEHGPVRAAHGSTVLVLGVAKLIKTSRTGSLWRKWKRSKQRQRLYSVCSFFISAKTRTLN